MSQMQIKTQAAAMLLSWAAGPGKQFQVFRPLPVRFNIVLSRSRSKESVPQTTIAASLQQALDYAGQRSFQNVFIIGGANIYQEALLHPDCRFIYLTVIHASFPCDVFMPGIPPNFRKLGESEIHEEEGIKFRFTVFSVKGLPE